ncbi:cell division protein ZapA [candidate division KSB1 bacterium]|nr:cell division protein ZapA [candidate division KSB1 bacterium]
MEPEKKTFKVNIYGTEYPIRGVADEDYILKVANYVDEKMREIDQKVAVKSALKVAILAALNITDELFRKRIESQELVERYENKISEIITRIEEIPFP